jgi:hypothetical protein
MEEQQSITSSTEPPGDRGRQSIRLDQIHQIILFRDEWEMSWGQITATLKLKRSTVQTAYNRWEKHGESTKFITTTIRPVSYKNRHSLKNKSKRKGIDSMTAQRQEKNRGKKEREEKPRIAKNWQRMPAN